METAGWCLTPGSIDNDSALEMLAVVRVAHTDIRVLGRHDHLCFITQRSSKTQVESIPMAGENM